MQKLYNNKTNEHIEVLVGEVLCGEHKKDMQISKSYEFKEEAHASLLDVSFNLEMTRGNE